MRFSAHRTGVTRQSTFRIGNPLIRKRLILLFVVQIALVLLLAGFYLRYHVAAVLEQQVGEKLSAIAATVSSQLDATLISMLNPGDENTRTFSNLRNRLTQMKAASGMERIVVMDPQGRVWLDTKIESIGLTYSRFNFDYIEIMQALERHPVSSVLFKAENDRLYKSGYAALAPVRGVVAVEGSAASLQAINRIESTLFQIGVFSIVLSFFLAIITSKSITRPLSRLQRAVEQISKGRFHRPVPASGRGEVAFLAHTMERMRQNILQRDEEQKAMLAGVAHEIRNPLGGIELFAGLLNDEIDRPELKEKTKKILKEAGNLKILVQNFLDYARPIQPRPKQCRISEIWHEAIALVKTETLTKNVRLQLDGDADIFVDPQHLKQIFLNLLLNSIQATSASRQNTIKMSVSVDKEVLIGIEDQGAGMTPEAAKRLFDPFFTDKANGLGLGLAMAKTFAEKNNGSIELLKSDDQGTLFELRFPAF
ncbi:HAMP domain-containing protein [candidate division KSB1 bacterium]|nr:HAMP domain-containing protein [candidate division KSB1 bacterium]